MTWAACALQRPLRRLYEVLPLPILRTLPNIGGEEGWNLANSPTRAIGVGLTAVHLDVPVTSPAVLFYERLGYGKLTETNLLEPKTSIPPHFRMYKSLSR